MAKKKAAPAEPPTFEAALERLERIVAELEQPELPLERSLAVFEEGVRLSRLLHLRLEEAERRVEILVEGEDGRKVPVPFRGAEGAGADAPAEAAEGDEDEENDEGADDGDDEGADGGGQRTLPF
jgi:exodeoxyribonuclease VII small subunit